MKYFEENKPQAETRHKGLLVLCILSWINLGFSFISVLVQFITGPRAQEALTQEKVDLLSNAEQMRELDFDALADFFEKTAEMGTILNENHYLYAFITLLVVILGTAAVYMMYMATKVGFHLYIIYSLLGIGSIYLFIAPSQIPSMIPIMGLVISGIFILLYSRHLSWLK